MNWKSDLQLRDLEQGQKLELTCLHCGRVHYQHVSDLLKHSDYRQLWLDELAEKLGCNQWGCHGRVRMALACDAETEGFQGSLP